MIHRTKKEKDYNKDKWIGIGGKFEENESPKECARREILEETGLTVNSLEYRGIVTFVSEDSSGTYYELMHLFWSDDFSTKDGTTITDCKSSLLPDCNEGDLQWIPISKMNDLPHWKGDEIFLDLIARREPFFSLKLVYKDGELINSVLE